MSHVAERITIEDAPPSAALKSRVAAALEAGEVVAMPTETVYGFAVRADRPAALEALRALKGRRRDEPLTWHVGRRDVVERFQALVPLARRLAERYWPGPLTLVLEGEPAGVPGVGEIARGGWTGVRLPAHRGTAGLIDALPFPVVLSSANASGSPPLVEPSDIVERFGARLALVLDGGRSRLGEPSVVLRLGRGSFELVRKGLMSITDLRNAAGLNIAFCCTGNTCRSPMAEGLAKLELARRLGVRGSERLADFGFSVSSFGVLASPGAPAAEHALAILRELGYDLSRHRSRPATLESVASFDRVYCLAPSHLESLRAMLPPGKATHIELLDPEGVPVPDPIGSSLEEYRRCMERIRELIALRAEEWA